MTANQPSGARPSTLSELVDNVQLAWKLIRDQRVSPLVRYGIPLLVAAYIISPVDILPDFIPGLGQVDDLAAIWMGLMFFLRSCPPDLVAAHRSGNKRSSAPADGNPDVVDAEYTVYDR